MTSWRVDHQAGERLTRSSHLRGGLDLIMMTMMMIAVTTAATAIVVVATAARAIIGTIIAVVTT